MSQAENSRRHYVKNRANRLADNKARKERNRQWFRDYKSKQKCKFCSESFPYCLDFHHREPEHKNLEVAKMVHMCYSIENILKEIEKCDVLCSNCHRKLHYGELV